MARAIKYRLQFKSKDGTGCLVNIWVEGASSSAVTSKTGADVPFAVESGVTALTGAEHPIEWEEDNDDSLLSVVRTKTGYLRVVEESYGDLRSMYPTTDTSHFVEFYYGSTRYFTGFMQAQAFDAEWAPGPRVIDFPIQSPLAVAKGLRFTAPTNPGFTNIGTLLYQACSLMNANISHIIIPDGISINSTSFTPLWRMSTLICCPFNDEFDRSANGSNSLYAPLTLYDFIEGLCNCLGLMVHDMPNYLVFSRYDYTGTYYNYDVSTLADLTPSGTPSQRGNYEKDYSSTPILGDDNREDEIEPVSKLELNYEGDFFESEGINYDHTRINSGYGSGSSSCQLAPVGYEVESSLLTTGVPNASNPGVSMGAWGGGKNIEECFLIYGNWSSTTKVLKYRFLIPPKNGGFTVTISVKQGTDLDEPGGGAISFGVIVKNSSNYYNAADGAHSWGSSEVINTVRRLEGTFDLKVQVDSACPSANQPLEIIITAGEMGSAGLIHLENINVSQGDAPGAKYYLNALNDGMRRKTLKVDNGSKVEAAISLLFNTAIKNKSMLLPAGANAYRDGAMPCTYDYMFQAQRRVVIDTFISHTPVMYTQLALFQVSGWHWRVTSVGFDPWNDKMRVALVYSPTI